MKAYCWLAFLTSALTLGACGDRSDVGDPPKSRDIALENPGFEESGAGDTFPGWNSFQHAGEQAYVVGAELSEPGAEKQSLRVTQTMAEYYGTVEQQVMATPDMIGKIVEFSALAKTRKVGPDGWSIFINFFDTYDHVLIQAVSPPLLGTTQWQSIRVSAKVPPNTAKFTVAAQMTDPSATANNGIGWLDDAKLTVREPTAADTPQ